MDFRWPLVVVACAAAVAVYLNTLHNPFVYDDHRLIVENTSLSALPDLYAVVMHEVTRPLVNLTYAVDWSIWGLDPFGFHLTNIVLHAVNVALVFCLTWLLTTDASARSRDTAAPVPNLTASATALVFAVNPMMTQAVGYISGRSELLCATFVLLTCLAARRFIITSRPAWALAACGTWTLALLSKEVAAIVPIALMLYDRWLAPPTSRPFRTRLFRFYLPMLAIMTMAVAARLWVLQRVEYPSDTFHSTYVLVQLEAIRRYAFLLLGQGPQSIFHQIDPYPGWQTTRGLVTLVTVPLCVLVVRLLYRLDRLTAFGAVWFLLCLIPSSTLFVLGRGEAMAEHRAYVAGIGFFMAFGVLVARGARLVMSQPVRTRRLAVVVSGIVLAQLAMHSVLRNMVWATPVGLWENAVAQAPGHWLPRLMLGEALREAGRCTEAIPEYRTALAGNPDEPIAYAHLGGCLVANNDLQAATGVFNELDSRYPDSSEAPAGLGVVAVAENRFDDAHTLLTESLRRDGSREPVRQLLLALEKRAEPSHAASVCAQIRTLAPFSQAAVECARMRGNRRP